ncbi:hypothetical protein [Caulobacter segnis]|uniref:hypothetical protein n=1 Tax=Caulobacter segnis TaxID=88688 RepID=UPI0028562BAA|nr:hypothetical protein [Caulobacter segnis]MDR6624815.1 hypothetical protein [Caulobacter segnis]
MKRGINLPSDWSFVEQVFPALRIGEPMAHVRHQEKLLSSGLRILQDLTSAQVRASLRGIELGKKSGLIIPVTNELRDQAAHLGRRLSREAAVDGDAKWRPREVMLCAMFLASEPSLNDHSG